MGIAAVSSKVGGGLHLVLVHRIEPPAWRQTRRFAILSATKEMARKWTRQGWIISWVRGKPGDSVAVRRACPKQCELSAERNGPNHLGFCRDYAPPIDRSEGRSSIGN